MGAPMPAMPPPPPPAMMMQSGQAGVTGWQGANQPPISGSGAVAGAEPSGIPPYLMMHQNICMLNQQLQEQQQIIMRLEKEKRGVFPNTNVSDEVARLFDQKENLQREIFGMHQVRQNLFLNIQQMQMDMQRMGMMQMQAFGAPVAQEAAMMGMAHGMGMAPGVQMDMMQMQRQMMTQQMMMEQMPGQLQMPGQQQMQHNPMRQQMQGHTMQNHQMSLQPQLTTKHINLEPLSLSREYVRDVCVSPAYEDDTSVCSSNDTEPSSERETKMAQVANWGVEQKTEATFEKNKTETVSVAAAVVAATLKDKVGEEEQRKREKAEWKEAGIVYYIQSLRKSPVP